MKTLLAIPDFHLKPTEIDIRNMLERNHQAHQDNGEYIVSEYEIRYAINVAKIWLENTTKTINAHFQFTAPNEYAGQFPQVRYLDGEDLGWTANNGGPYPFNTPYVFGPSVHVHIHELQAKPRLNVSRMWFESFGTCTCEDGRNYLRIHLPDYGFRVTLFARMTP